jgi:hypothetical protein
VALLLAVLAGIRVDTSLGAITSTVTLFLAVYALNGRLMRLVLGDLLLAVLIQTLGFEHIEKRTPLTFLMWPSSLQLLHSGTPRSWTKPHEARRVKFCSGDSGQP